MVDEESVIEEHLRDVDFPHPREDCLSAVADAHTFIAERGVATKAEILDGIAPEKHHRIGITAAQAVGKLNDVRGYRVWFWDTVLIPGFRALPSIEHEDGRWAFVGHRNEDRHNDSPDQPPGEPHGHSRGQADRAAASYNYESDSDPESTQRETVTNEEVEPRRQPPDLDELYDVLSNPKAPPRKQLQAADALRTVANEQSDIGDRFVEPIVKLLDRPSMGSKHILLWSLRSLATHESHAVFEHSDAICGFISPEATHETKAALACCVELVDIERAAFVDIAPALRALALEADNSTANNAAYLLGQVAKDHPRDVSSTLDGLHEELASVDPYVQSQLLLALGNAVPYIDDTDSVIESVMPLLESDDSMVRGNATAVIADATIERHDLVDSDIAIPLLEDEDANVRANAASIILNIARESPATCEKTVGPLIDLLDDPSGTCRRNACRALGHLDAAEAFDALQSTAMFDPDASVRAAARSAISEQQSAE